MILTARELRQEDISLIGDYWASASPEYLHGMGADHKKMPTTEQFHTMLENQLAKPYPDKAGYATIWEINGTPAGHCNINNIKFQQEANMHLHMWQGQNRQKGMGATLVKKSLPFFFKNFELQRLICEPYALNPAPNKTLPKIGFEFIEKYQTVPGNINFSQEVNRYEMSKEIFESIF